MISSRFWQVSLILSIVLGVGATGRAEDFASRVVDSSNLGLYSPYDYAGAALGRPTLSYYDLGKPTLIFKTSLVAGANNLMPADSAPNYDPDDPNSCKVAVTIRNGGYLVVAFDTPIEDDPANWYGRDFIVFGNSAFNGSGLVPGYVAPDTDMEQYWIDAYADGRWESGVVSVSQYENGPWYTYTDGPYADNFAPTQAYAWDYIRHAWGPQMDFTMPLAPSVTKASFEAREVDGVPYPLSAAEAIDLYKGSGGGTAFDLAGLDLPVNAAGRKWIRYIKFGGSGEEVDAVSRVSHAIAPVSIAQAKMLPDDARVILTEQTVSAGTDDFGDCCYVQSPGGVSGIKVTGRVIARGRKVIVHGVMATGPAGEREIRATCMEALPG